MLEKDKKEKYEFGYDELKPEQSTGSKILTGIIILSIIVLAYFILSWLYPNSSQPKHFEQMDGTEDPYWSP